MTNLIFAVSLSAILSGASLLMVLLRVSPLISPAQALPAFFVSLFLTISTTSMLAAIVLWKHLPHHWDTGKFMTVCMRQGVFIGLGSVTVVLFHLLGLLNWWIIVLIYSVFLFVELALQQT